MRQRLEKGTFTSYEQKIIDLCDQYKHIYNDRINYPTLLANARARDIVLDSTRFETTIRNLREFDIIDYNIIGKVVMLSVNGKRIIDNK